MIIPAMSFDEQRRAAALAAKARQDQIDTVHADWPIDNYIDVDYEIIEDSKLIEDKK